MTSDAAGSPWAGVVGRVAESEAVEAFLTDLASGRRGCALLIEGEAGQGKSVIWRAAVAIARQRGITVISCEPAAAEQALSFVSLRDLLDSVSADDLDRLPPPQANALGSALLLQPAGDSVDQAAVGVALTSLLRRWASDGPLVLAIDDSQWLDPPSARAIGFAIRRLTDARIGLLLTRRTGEAAPVFELAATTLEAQARRLALGPISFGGLHRILTERTGHRFGRPIVARIETSSGGNPMTAIEIGRALIDSGETGFEPGQPLPVPGRLRDLLGARLARLGPASQDALLLASMLSRPTTPLIAAASEDPATARIGLDEAEAEGIVEIQDDAIRFSHPLFASVVQAPLSQAARRSLHLRLGNVLPEGEERAYHLALAATEPDAELADQLEVAGRLTSHRGAPDLGADLLARARTLTPPDRPEDRARRATMEGEARFEAGDLSASRAVLEDAVTWIEPGRQRAEALLLLGTVQWYLGGSPASAVLDAALLDATDDPALRGRIHGRLAILSNDIATARAHGRAAIELIDPKADPFGYAFARLSLFFVDVQSGALPDLAAFEAAMALEVGVPTWEVSTIPILWWKYTGEFERAHERLDLHLQWARDSGDESSDAELYAHVAELEMYAGDWSAAADAAGRAVEAADQMGQPVPHTADRANGMIRVLQGRLHEAVTIAEAGIAATGDVDPELKAMYLDVLASARAAALDRQGVIEALDRQAVVLAGIGIREPLRYRTEGEHIEALVSSGALDAAHALVDRLQARHDVIPRAWIAATLARSRALIAEAEGDAAGAAQDLAAFLDDTAPPAGVEPFEMARALLVLGQIERRLGHRRSAGARLEAALTAFETLPAPIWVAHTRQELDRLGRRRSGVDELTPAEARVTRLIAAGMTNKAAAERLVLSPKTVEAHLARAYTKLGIRSRAELGRWMAEGGSATLGEADDPAL